MITNAHAVLTGGAQQIAASAPGALGWAIGALVAVLVFAALLLLPSCIAYRRLGRRPAGDDQVQQLDFPDWVSPRQQALIRRAREEDRLEAEADAMAEEYRKQQGEGR